MFTGLIEERGFVKEQREHAGGIRMTFSADLVTADLRDGDSIAVNGVCLTALDVSHTAFSAEVSPETLDRSTLGSLGADSPVNLERAMLPTQRLGGHLVQGHVDGPGIFQGAMQEGGFWTVTIEFPQALARYFVEKGSVAVEGISLTIAALREDSFDIAVIPKTWDVTNLSYLKKGDHVNLEVDVIAKYVERLLLNADSQQMKGNIDRC